MCDYEYFIEQTPFRESCKELVLDVLPHCLELIKHLSTLWTWSLLPLFVYYPPLLISFTLRSPLTILWAKMLM